MSVSKNFSQTKIWSNKIGQTNNFSQKLLLLTKKSLSKFCFGRLLFLVKLIFLVCNKHCVKKSQSNKNVGPKKCWSTNFLSLPRAVPQPSYEKDLI